MEKSAAQEWGFLNFYLFDVELGKFLVILNSCFCRPQRITSFVDKQCMVGPGHRSLGGFGRLEQIMCVLNPWGWWYQQSLAPFTNCFPCFKAIVSCDPDCRNRGLADNSNSTLAPNVQETDIAVNLVPYIKMD